jgi:hypothetical protein
VTVTTDVLVPSAVILVGVASIVDVTGDAGPATNATTAVAGDSEPLTVNETVATALAVDEVRVAV